MTQIAHTFRLVVPVVLVCFLQPTFANDFGDAPDGGPTGYPAPFAQTGSFPTLDGSGGANTADLNQATLGPTASSEADANDPTDPDGQPNLINADSDDGIVDFVLILTSIPARAGMAVNVVGPPGSTRATFWINVLIDMNMNGQWDGVIGPSLTEWAVVNFPVVVGPGVSQNVSLPPFFFGNGNRVPDGAWMRIALTERMITDPRWNGGGDFAAGEVEDHVIDLPRLTGGTDTPGPGPGGKSCIPAMQCPRKVSLPSNGGVRGFVCTIANLGADDCTFEFRLKRVNGGAEAFHFLPWTIPCAPNGPQRIDCGPTRVIGPPLPLLFLARKNGKLPSRWQYRAAAVDPDAVITSEGVTVGFGDSTGDVDFLSDERTREEQDARYFNVEELRKFNEIAELKKLEGLEIVEMEDDSEQRKILEKLYRLDDK